MISITLFESIIVLVIIGVCTVAWWGVRRLVKTNDDGALVLIKIHDSLSLICERLGKVETWMEQHEKLDDVRHTEIKNVYQLISRVLIDKNTNSV